MAKKVVKPSEQALSLEIHPPKIAIENDLEPMTPRGLRAYFIGQIINGLVTKHGDLGGRNDKGLINEAFRLADEMVEVYFNT